MRLTVFGATGATGAQLIAQALRAGHEVNAVVAREPPTPSAEMTASPACRASPSASAAERASFVRQAVSVAA